MIRILLCVTTVFALAFTACKNTTTAANANAPDGSVSADTLVSAADATDLLETLQGKWQNDRDPAYIIEITDDKIKRYQNGQASGESEIEVDANCLSNACKVDSTNLLEGWCFIEKGQFDAQCNLVLKCDKKVLQYQVLGATSDTLRFSKK